MTMIMLFNAISLTFESTLNVASSLNYIDHKYLQGNNNPSVLLAEAKYFLLIA